MSESENTTSWQFQRMGDNDQVLLRTVTEIRRLPELDPKLWGALSCPADGLEYDKASAAILDTDGDGRIRVPEVLEAVNWTCARLADTVDLSKPEAAMPLSAIDTSKPEGQHCSPVSAIQKTRASVRKKPRMPRTAWIRRSSTATALFRPRMNSNPA